MSNPHLELRNVRFEVFTDSEELGAEPLRDCWVYLFWYNWHGEGAFTYEAYVDDDGKYHLVDTAKHGRKDIRPHVSRAHDSIWLPISMRRGGGRAPVLNVPIVSPFQLPVSRLPKVPFDQTLTRENLFFETLHEWLAKEREILASSFVAGDLVKSGHAWVARLRTPWHRALSLGWDLTVAQRRLAAELRANPRQAKLLCLHKAIESIVAGGKGRDLIREAELKADKLPLARFERAQEQFESAGDTLLRHIQRRPFDVMFDDMIAAGGEAYVRFMIALAPVLDLLPSLPQATAYLSRIFERSNRLLTDQGYKTTRKGAKAVWAFLKAAIKTATGTDDKSKKVRARLVEWVEYMTRTKVTVDERGFIAAKTMTALEKKVVETLTAHRAFLLIDGYNLLISANSLTGPDGKVHVAKALSAASAAFSLLGTAAGRVEFAMKTSGDAVGEAVWKATKNELGIVGNVADAAASAWQAYKELDTDDTDAAIAQIVGAVGAGVQVYGYAMALAGAGGPIILAIGATVAAGAAVAYLLADNDDLEDWLTHCWWGRARDSTTKAVTKWSEGSLSSFHKDPDRQLRALNRILFAFTVEWDHQTVNPVLGRSRSSLALRITANRMPDGACFRVKISARGDGQEHIVHPEGTWAPRHVERDTHGRVALRDEMDLLLYEEVRVEARLDIYGNEVMFIPPANEPPQIAILRIPMMDRMMRGRETVPA